MGCIYSNKTKSLEDILINMYIWCSFDGTILNIDSNTVSILKYEKTELINKFIGCIMTEMLSNLHRDIYLKRLASQNIENKMKSIEHLNNRTKSRPLIIYTKERKPLYVYMNLEKETEKLKIQFTLTNPYLTESEYENIFSRELKTHTAYNDFVYSKTKVIIICIDFVNSTSNLMSNGDKHTATLSLNFFNMVKNIIKQKYYPYVYIHEIVGDSFVFIINADWTYNIPELCATIAFDFMKDLINNTKFLTNIRVGCAYGDILYGYIGNQLRLFGPTINMASRLEHKSMINHILINEEMYQKMISENISFNYTKSEYELKGFANNTPSYLVKII
jgi:class 3 adenylate cyclase